MGSLLYGVGLPFFKKGFAAYDVGPMELQL